MNRALNVKPRLEIDRRVGLWQTYAMPYRFAARQPGTQARLPELVQPLDSARTPRDGMSIRRD
jgi:hypothetical protein